MGVCFRMMHYYPRKAILLSTAPNELQTMEGSQAAATANTETSRVREIKMWHLYSLHRRKCHFICSMGRIFSPKSPWGISKYPQCHVWHSSHPCTGYWTWTLCSEIWGKWQWLQKPLADIFIWISNCQGNSFHDKAVGLTKIPVHEAPTQPWCREQQNIIEIVISVNGLGMATGVKLNENTDIAISTPGNSLGCASYMMWPSKVLQNRWKKSFELDLVEN